MSKKSKTELSPEDIQNIKKEFESGISQRALAKKYLISRTLVLRILGLSKPNKTISEEKKEKIKRNFALRRNIDFLKKVEASEIEVYK